MNEIATIDQEVAQFQERLAQVEAAIDSVPVDQLGDAMQWIREQQAVLKARKRIGQIVIAAKRLEAKLLQRMGRLAESTPEIFKIAGLTTAEKSAAKYLAELTDEGFNNFLSFLGESGKVSSDVTAYRRDEQERGYRQQIRAQAESGDSPRVGAAERQVFKQTVDEWVAEIIMTGDGHSSRDIVVGLAETIGIDAEDPVSRAGLNHVITAAFARVKDEERGYARYDDGTECISAEIPVQVAVNYDEWVRVPWSAATVEQMTWNADYWEVQADSIARKAHQARQMVQLLTTLQKHHPDIAKCDDLLTAGRRNGLVRYTELKKVNRANQCDRFSKLFDGADNYHGVIKALCSIADDLEEFGYYDDDDLTPEVAASLAPRLFTGANVKSMERFAEAYCPELIGSFDIYRLKPVDWAAKRRAAHILGETLTGERAS